MPVARKVWLPIGAVMPAAAARRRIMRQASDWSIGWSVSTVALCPRAGAEQPALAVLGDAGGGDVGVQRLGERVMARHRVLLAAFLVQPDLPAGALRPEILHLHLQRRADAREGIGEGGDQRAVAQIAHGLGRDGVDAACATRLPSSTGVLPVFTTCFGPRTAAAGLVGTTWPVISQSNSIRTAASCCFTPGAEWVSLQLSIPRRPRRTAGSS